MTTPTTEIDSVDANLISLENFPHLHKKVVYADFARKLERERDEARLENKSWKQLHDADEQCINNQLAELTQLRKVCDDWHITAMTIMESSNDIHAACERLKPLMKQHSTLPHVIKAKETKPDDMYESLTSDEEFNGH